MCLKRRRRERTSRFKLGKRSASLNIQVSIGQRPLRFSCSTKPKSEQSLVPISSHNMVSQKKKLSAREGRPTQCGSWRHTKQPYLGRFFISHQDHEIFGSKVSKFHYFCIIFSFVVILMKNFEIYIINRYYREETPEFPVHIFQQKTMFFVGKT